MFEMSSHIAFEYLKHKLWPREELRINCQFDSRPRKVKNRPDLITFRWRATYCWKALDKNYNFALDLTSIGGLHKKLWASIITKVPISRISGLPTWESQDKMTFECKPHGQA